MTATVHRSAPPAMGGGRPPAPPAGAAGWSRTFVDARGLPQVSDVPVPVDADGRRTAHVRFGCAGRIEVGGVRQPCDTVRWLLSDQKPGFCPDHGCELVADVQARPWVLPVDALWAAVEAPLRPAYGLAAAAALGVAEHVGDVAVGWPLVGTPVAVAGVYAGVRWWLTRGAVKRGRVDRGQRSGRRVEAIRRRARYGAYVTATAGTWLSAAALVDPASGVGKAVWASLPVAWAVSAAPWWAYLRRRRDRPALTPVVDSSPVTAVAVPTPDEVAAQQAAAAWTEHVGAANTALDVTTWARITCGWQAVVVATKPGALNRLGGDAMKATVKTIASAYDVPRSAITLIEEYEESPNRALLLVQPNNPLKEPQLWGGPDSIRITPSRIESDMGRLIDGAMMVEVQFRFEEGMPSELVLGTTGSGKSERLRAILVRDRWTHFINADGQPQGVFINFLHDPKRLNSFGEFRDAIHGYGMTRDDAHIMADALLRECMRRYDMLREIVWEDSKGRRRRGSVKWNPLVHGPLIRTIWDEHHELAGDQEFVKKKERIARYQRACGMGDVLASHMGTIGDTGSQALRDMLAGGRASLLRTTSGLNAALATGGQLTADPRALPKLGGMVLVADGETPTMMGRYSLIPDDRMAERLGVRSVYDWLFDDDNQPIGFPAVIPAETAEAFGPEFMEWAAAGRSAAGRDGWSYSGAPAAVPAEARSSQDALRRILFKAGGPVSRDTIVKDPLWSFGVTSTLTAALKASRDASPPWALQSGTGRATTYELAPWLREQMAAEVAEQ